MLPIKLLHKIELFPLILRSNVCVLQVGNHFVRIQVGMIDMCSLKLSRQECAPPKFGAQYRFSGTKSDEGREVLILSSQTIGQP